MTESWMGGGAMEDRWLKTAYSYLFIRDFDKAMDIFRQAMASNPEHAEYFFHASITAVRSGLLEDALVWAHTAAMLEPHNTLYRDHYGMVKAKELVRKGIQQMTTGAASEAQECFEAALQLDPLNDEANRHLKFARNRQLHVTEAPNSIDTIGEVQT